MKYEEIDLPLEPDIAEVRLEYGVFSRLFRRKAIRVDFENRFRLWRQQAGEATGPPVYTTAAINGRLMTASKSDPTARLTPVCLYLCTSNAALRNAANCRIVPKIGRARQYDALRTRITPYRSESNQRILLCRVF